MMKIFFLLAFTLGVLCQRNLLDGYFQFQKLERHYNYNFDLGFQRARDGPYDSRSGRYIDAHSGFYCKFNSYLIKNGQKIPIYYILRNSNAVIVYGFPSKPHFYDHTVLLTIPNENLIAENPLKRGMEYYFGYPLVSPESRLKNSFSYRAIFQDENTGVSEKISVLEIEGSVLKMYGFYDPDVRERGPLRFSYRYDPNVNLFVYHPAFVDPFDISFLLRSKNFVNPIGDVMSATRHSP